jgi:hypothetical protein
MPLFSFKRKRDRAPATDEASLRRMRLEQLQRKIEFISQNEPSAEIEAEYIAMAMEIIDERIKKLEAAACDLALDPELRERSRRALVKFRELRVQTVAKGGGEGTWTAPSPREPR